MPMQVSLMDVCSRFRWPEVAQVSRASFAWRLRALPALYTAFYEARTRGCPVARPLVFAFPRDVANARGVHLQWMLGDSLLVSPVVRPAPHTAST